MPTMSPSNHAAHGIDIIVRYHDPARLLELDRAVFSLVCQEYRPLRILITCQRFSEESLEAIRTYFRPMLSWAGEVSLEVLNYAPADPQDARSELVNLGFAAATGRYVALLDYDDVLYPEAYRILINQLKAGSAAIAFASVQVSSATIYPKFLHALDRFNPFRGKSLKDIFSGNFAPIHSYVLDRSRIPAEALRFEKRLTIEEDYDFLLRVCATVESDFTLLGTEIGLYFYKTDASNTFSRQAPPPPATMARIETAQSFVELRRKMTPLAPDVQVALGVAPVVPGLTIREFLDR